MSSASNARRVGHDDQRINPAPDRFHRMRQSHVSHYLSDNNSRVKGYEAESNDILALAGEKADEQRENNAAYTGSTPQILASSDISPFIPPFTTPLGLVSVPATIISSVSVSLLAIDTSPLPQSTDQKRSASESQPTTSVSSPLSSSSASSMHFPPALLAFILIFAFLFCVMMFLAFRRMCCRKQARVQLPSPLFLGHTTDLGSDGHNDDAMELDKPKIITRNAMVRFEQDVLGSYREEIKTGSLKSTERMPQENTRLGVHLDALNVPPPAHVSATAQSQSRRSRVLRPYVPRPYHRSHPTGAESVKPPIDCESLYNGDVQRMRSKDKGFHSRVCQKEKENVVPDTAADSGGRTPARAMDRPPRPLSIIATVIDSSATLSAVDGRNQVSSSTSVNLGQDVPSDSHSDAFRHLPASGTVADDIGLAMLTEFSSPNVGPGFDPHSMSGSLLATDWDHLPPSSNVTDLGKRLSHLTQSASYESDGLAYLASDSSHSSTTRCMMEGYNDPQSDSDIASTLECRRDQQLDHRAQAHARLLEQLNLAIDPDTHLPDPPVASFKPPFLPTLSEMALSRADPLYESVTNELFASYGVRMSTASGRMSRVSARISRMLSWFGDDAASIQRLSIGDEMSDEIDWMSEQGDKMSGVSALGGSVQPLRIGKLRRKSSE